ncbi:MAG: UvrD-helicase domain-containing protein [Rhodoferax sp.]
MASSNNAHITFISAGAGSGKTHRLTEILHRELSEGQIRPSGVIATTFTKKAATELRERVRGHLLGQGAFSLANEMGQARIGTVNSVCGQLIERFAFEAGMATQQQVLEEVQAKVMLGKAIDAVFDGPSMSAFLTIVRRLGLIAESSWGNSDDWRDHLKALVDQIRANDMPKNKIAGFAARNAKDLLAHFPKPAKDDLSGRLIKAIRDAMPEIERVAQAGEKKNTNTYLALLRRFERDLESGSVPWGEWFKLSKTFPEVGLKTLAEPIAELAGRAAEHPGLHKDIASYLEQMFALASKALAIYTDNKRDMGVLDFADQEHQLLKLLDHPEVVKVLGDELDLLMVDEFQDTSPIQLALFLKLAQYAKRVYWVGDIKQAIYGFRGSDTELMKSILRELPALGGVKDILPTSWRSRSELVRLVNAIFVPAFSGSLPKVEVELKPQRDDELPGPSISNWMLGGKNIPEEATALAGGIHRLVNSGYLVLDKGATVPRAVCYGDIAVLARLHTGVTAIGAALTAQGIPAATSQPGLLATAEATLALACLRRLNDSGDTIASAEIASLADCTEPEAWVSDRLRHLQAGGESDDWLEVPSGGKEPHPVLAVISSMRKNLPLLAPREALQTVITACELPAKVLRWSKTSDLARMRLANLEALLDLATKYEDLCRGGQHAASISGLILYLGELATEGEDLRAEPAINAVKVMTHHGAKGLEWPVVVLTDLAANIKDRLWSISAQPGETFNVRSPLDDRFIRYWPWPFGAQKKVSVADEIALTPMAAQFRASAVEEAKRLLYVSMTRARDLMVLARSSRNNSGEWLDCLDASWLLQEKGAQEIVLPTGESMAAERWDLDPVDPSLVPLNQLGEALHWFPAGREGIKRPALNFSPSTAATISTRTLEKCRVGERIPVRDGADMTILGTAIHACVAMSCTDLSQAVTVSEVERLLASFGVSDCISGAGVLRQVKALHDWIQARWPNASISAEYPVQSILESGQVLSGRLDLLLQTTNGWILIDHKSTQLAPDHWEQLASEYGAQLGAYAKAIEKASGRPVLESWLFLPVAAGAIRLALQ